MLSLPLLLSGYYPTKKVSSSIEVDKHAVSRAEVEWHGTNIGTMWPRYFPEKFSDQFDLTKARWDSGDGLYHETGEAFIVVDMEDPTDPFRDEVKGIKFDFVSFDSNGTRTNYQSLPAPSKSYVTFSKVKVVVDSDINQGLTPSVGGFISVNPMGLDSKSENWPTVLSAQESSDTVLYTKTQSSQNAVDVNRARGNWEHRPILKSGTHYFVRAQLHPKGDGFLQYETVVNINFQQNIDYERKSPNGRNIRALVSSRADFNAHN